MSNESRFPSVPIEPNKKSQYSDLFEALNQSRRQYFPINQAVQVTKIGEGSYGMIYQLRSNNESVVIKKINTSNRLVQKEIKDEIKVLRHLQENCDKYILCYQDSVSIRSFTYIITESLGNYITLHEYIESKQPNMTISNEIIIINELIQGLQYIHNNNVVHRDIKPENIMININNNMIKYIDFGKSCINSCNFNVGSFYNIPPEIFQNMGLENNIDFDTYKKGDIWSLGLVIFVLISGIEIYDIIEHIINDDKIGIYKDIPKFPNYPQLTLNQSIIQFHALFTTIPTNIIQNMIYRILDEDFKSSERLMNPNEVHRQTQKDFVLIKYLLHNMLTIDIKKRQMFIIGKCLIIPLKYN